MPTHAEQWLALCLCSYTAKRLLLKATGLTIEEIDELNYQRMMSVDVDA